MRTSGTCGYICARIQNALGKSVIQQSEEEEEVVEKKCKINTGKKKTASMCEHF